MNRNKKKTKINSRKKSKASSRKKNRVGSRKNSRKKIKVVSKKKTRKNTKVGSRKSKKAIFGTEPEKINISCCSHAHDIIKKLYDKYIKEEDISNIDTIIIDSRLANKFSTLTNKESREDYELYKDCFKYLENNNCTIKIGNITYLKPIEIFEYKGEEYYRDYIEKLCRDRKKQN